MKASNGLEIPSSWAHPPGGGSGCSRLIGVSSSRARLSVCYRGVCDVFFRDVGNSFKFPRIHMSRAVLKLYYIVMFEPLFVDESDLAFQGRRGGKLVKHDFVFPSPKMSQIQQGYQVKVAKASEANFTMSWASHFCALLERNFQHGIRLVTIISVANYASLCSIKIGHETARLGRFRLPKTGTYRDKYTIQL